MEFKRTVKGGQRRSSGDMRWKSVPQMRGCNRKRSVADSANYEPCLQSTSALGVLQWCVLQSDLLSFIVQLYTCLWNDQM